MHINWNAFSRSYLSFQCGFYIIIILHVMSVFLLQNFHSFMQRQLHNGPNYQWKNELTKKSRGVAWWPAPRWRAKWQWGHPMASIGCPLWRTHQLDIWGLDQDLLQCCAHSYIIPIPYLTNSSDFNIKTTAPYIIQTDVIDAQGKLAIYC